mmetsp:Transcript_714/g.1653  ORF Transcript_714/g.1653 Transcript_714/m.1653 type:complete len:207 (+) Transcript_714:699-1319(+)
MRPFRLVPQGSHGGARPRRRLRRRICCSRGQRKRRNRLRLARLWRAWRRCGPTSPPYFSHRGSGPRHRRPWRTHAIASAGENFYVVPCPLHPLAQNPPARPCRHRHHPFSTASRTAHPGKGTPAPMTPRSGTGYCPLRRHPRPYCPRQPRVYHRHSRHTGARSSWIRRLRRGHPVRNNIVPSRERHRCYHCCLCHRQRWQRRLTAP